MYQAPPAARAIANVAKRRIRLGRPTTAPLCGLRLARKSTNSAFPRPPNLAELAHRAKFNSRNQWRRRVEFTGNLCARFQEGTSPWDGANPLGGRLTILLDCGLPATDITVFPCNKCDSCGERSELRRNAWPFENLCCNCPAGAGV